jgi:hypothetical protein
VPLFRQAPLGRRSGSPETEALREEVHRFVGSINTRIRSFQEGDEPQHSYANSHGSIE